MAKVAVGAEADTATVAADTALVVVLANPVARASDAIRTAVAAARASVERYDTVSAGTDTAAGVETAVAVQPLICFDRAIAERFAGNAWVSVGDAGAVAAIPGTAVFIDTARITQRAIAISAVIAELRFRADIAAIERLPAAIREF